MARIIIYTILRLVMIMLLVSEYRLKNKIRKGDLSLSVDLTPFQKNYRVVFYFLMLISLILPANIYTGIYSVLCLVYFFIFTDREIYFNHNSMHFRDTYYHFKKIKNIQYEKHVLSFSYEGQTIKLRRPYCSEDQLQQVIARVQRVETRQEEKSERRKKH